MGCVLVSSMGRVWILEILFYAEFKIGLVVSGYEINIFDLKLLLLIGDRYYVINYCLGRLSYCLTDMNYSSFSF